MKGFVGKLLKANGKDAFRFLDERQIPITVCRGYLANLG
jgi:hypothetical protein